MGVKSSYVKELLVHEFGASLGFYVPPRKNRSEVVYDTSGSASYIEAAISLLGISNEQLVQTVSGMRSSKQQQFPGPHRLVSLSKRKLFLPFLLN